MMTEDERRKGRERCRRHRQKDPELFRQKRREWYAKNPERIARYKQTKKEKRPLAQAQYSKRWRSKNPEKQREACRDWEKRNREHVNAKARERLAANPALKIQRRLRCRMRYALHNQSTCKSAKTSSLLGCEPAFLARYLQARFTPEMTWENYGSVWEVDHVTPCSAYDLTKAAQQRKCFHFSNLQPLLKGRNRSKGPRVPTQLILIP